MLIKHPIPPVSARSLYVADIMLREFPCITHGISYPPQIGETREEERAYMRHRIAAVIQGATAGAMLRLPD